MSYDPLEFPDVKEYRVERSMSQLSSILSTIAKPQIKGSSGTIRSNEDMSSTSEGPPQEGASSMDVLDKSAGLTQGLMGRNGGMGLIQLKIFLLSQQADAAELQFKRWGAIGYLDKAIECWRQVLALTPDGHEDKPAQFGLLGTAFSRRFDCVGNLEDLNMAIEHLIQAVQLTPDWDDDKPISLNNLGITYRSRFERLGELEDLNKAIECQTQAVLLTPDGDPDMPSRLTNLGVSYWSRFERLGELADLNKAIKYKTQAVVLAPDGHPGKHILLANLGNSYQSRFWRLGELIDINRAIEYKSQALMLVPDGHAQKPTLLNNLGNSYDSRFKRLGNLDDVNEAIKYQSQAVQLTPDGHSDKSSWFNNLGIKYESRYRRLGELVDLDKAVHYQNQAVLLTPDGHADKPNRLNNLGCSYQSRFARFGELSDVDKAIRHQTQAVLLTPDGHAEKPNWLNNLGNSHRYRFERLGELVDINKATESQSQAVLLTPDGHADKPKLLNNLGTSHQSRFGRLGEVVDLNRAIEHQAQAVLLTPDGHVDRPSWLYNLGHAYESRFKQLGDRSDLSLAQTSFQHGAQLLLIDPKYQSRCARKWAHCALLLDSSPRPAYERCMELIPHYVWLGTTINQRYVLLQTINDLATEAASWAISVQAFDLALEWLEAGRSVLWNQILQLRTPFDDIFLVDPVLAQDLKETASSLESAGSREPAFSSDNAPDLEKDAQQHHRLASKWEQLLEKARTLPGFHNFLRPRKTKELVLSATDGPVVVLNIHFGRCDALMILPESEDISYLPLPNFSLDALSEAREQLGSLVGDRSSEGRGLRLKPTAKPHDTFRSVLAACWSNIVQPVLEVLAYQNAISADKLPHLTWCTTGTLSFLPLHAAGLYNGTQSNAPDLVVSSYTPTLSALLTANTPPANPSFGVLAVGQEQTQGFASLPSTVRELSVIKEHAKATRFQQLDGSSATVDAVLGAMDNNSWVHLACHATQNRANPAHSAFHLQDGSLSLETITKRSFKNKGLAFLSACQTATGDEKLADEAVHLAAGMLMAGYPSVIATMWSIQDEDGPKIAEAVYADLLKDGKMNHKHAARALHKAVGGLRENVGVGAFKRWVPFIHIGV